MLVHEFLTRSAARFPQKVALVCDGRRLTYAELDDMTDRLGNALVQGGVGRGDRVALHLPNSVEAVVGIFAALKAGGTFVCINASTKAEKLAYILNDCRAKALLMQERTGGWDAVPSLSLGVLCGAQETPADPRLRRFEETLAKAPATPLPLRNIDLDLACLVYTSGSTGEPKGVMCDHSNVDFASTAIMTYLENRAEDVILSALPLSFDYGLYQLLMAFKMGGTLVLERSFMYPTVILQQIQEERPTGFPGVPTIFAMLVQKDLRAYDTSSLRYLTNTAASLPPSRILELQAAFPGVALYSMYGLTETKRTLYLPPDQLAIRPGSVGIPIPGTEAWIEDESGRRLGPGETGELVVRGRHVMRGYWEAPEATAQRFRPGPIPGERLCYSGDLFRQDADGYFYFLSRKDDIIKSRGEKVAPKEVENVLHMLPGVTAVVVGVPDPTAGEVVKAFVVANGTPLTEAQVIAHCRAHLEDFMVPKYVEFRTDLPMTSSGKISRLGLR
ncbi:class I adenylate-forming enzyme family protein [Geothrix mesophila]|uniref:class I adenylate-forming enzyme family protein n=1 Tax=Geothrix mesophila TaxID=2922723 RepID=UPI001FADDACB